MLGNTDGLTLYALRKQALRAGVRCLGFSFVGWISEVHPPFDARIGGCASLIHPTVGRYRQQATNHATGVGAGLAGDERHSRSSDLREFDKPWRKTENQ